MRTIILALLTLGIMSFAVVATSATLVEPTTTMDANGNPVPLDDLASCRAIVTDQIGRTGSRVFPASSPAGGSSFPFEAREILPIGEGAIDIFGVCTDLGGAESAESNHLSDNFPQIPSAPPTLSD